MLNLQGSKCRQFLGENIANSRRKLQSGVKEHSVMAMQRSTLAVVELSYQGSGFSPTDKIKRFDFRAESGAIMMGAPSAPRATSF